MLPDAGCLLFLIDQSDAMNISAGPGEPPAQEVVARAVNRWLFEGVVRASRGPDFAPFDVGVLGFATDASQNATVQPVWTGPLAGRPLVPASDLAAHPAWWSPGDFLAHDPDTGAPMTVTVSVPEWVSPAAAGTSTLCNALYHADRFVLEGWVNSHAHAAPPTVIAFVGGDQFEPDPVIYAKSLRELSTQRGPLTLAVIHFSPNATAPTLYPGHPDDVPPPSMPLFESASRLSEAMVRRAAARGEEIVPEARAMALNPTAERLDAVLGAVLGGAPAPAAGPAGDRQTVSRLFGNTAFNASR